jgi:uncharacterized repeat protein (TIGR01451 family)
MMNDFWANWKWNRNGILPSLAKLLRFHPGTERLEDRTVPSVTLGVTAPGIPGSSSFCGCLPPDGAEAAGPSNVVQAVNTAMEIRDKAGNLLSGPTSLPTFFSGHGWTVANMSDPTVIYDELAQRFVIEILDYTSANATNFLDFAVSNSSDATAGFTNFRHINVGESSFFADQPRIGFNADAYFVQFNMFSTVTGRFNHSQVFTIQKSDFLTGGLTTFHHDFANSSNLASIDPAVMHGAVAGGPEYFVSEGVNIGTTIVWKETNVLSNTPTDVQTNFTVASYSEPPAAPQPSGSVTTNDSRMLNAAFRDNILVATQTVGDGSPVEAHARWYQFNVSSTPTLTMSGDVTNGSAATYFPSIDIDSNDDIGMSYIESSSSEFVSMYVTGRTPSDAAGTMETGARVIAGTTNYTGSRMGDYSGTSVDPSNTTTFWSENEWINNASAGSWNTEQASFSVASVSTGSADLSVQNTGPTTTVNEGDNVTYTVTVTNGGPNDAANTVLTYTLDPNLKFVSANSPFSVSGNVVTFSLGTVANGATVTVTITAQAIEDGNLTNVASVSSSTSDPNQGNNSQNASTTVTEPSIVPPSSTVTVTAKRISNLQTATFTHANGVEPASAFSATINWGDGRTSAGTITQSGSTYIVTGSHNYKQPGTHTVTTTVVEAGSPPNVIVTTPAVAGAQVLLSGPGAATVLLTQLPPGLEVASPSATPLAGASVGPSADTGLPATQGQAGASADALNLHFAQTAPPAADSDALWAVVGTADWSAVSGSGL